MQLRQTNLRERLVFIHSVGGKGGMLCLFVFFFF